VANALGFLSNLAIAFFVSPFLVHSLGDARYGVWALVESVLAYLSLLDLGVGASVVRYIARFHETDDTQELNRIFSTSVCIFTGAGLVIFVITSLLAFLPTHPLGVSEPLATETRWLLFALGLNLAVNLPLVVYSAALDGLGQYPRKNAVRMAVLIVGTLSLVAVVKNGGGLLGVGAVILLRTLLDSLLMACLVRWQLPQMRFSLRSVDHETFSRIRGYSGHAFVIMLADRIAFQTDAVVIGACLAPNKVAYFMIAARLVRLAKDGVRTLTIVLTPAVSGLDARGSFARIRRIAIEVSRAALYLILPVQMGMLLLGQAFLKNWLGPTYVTECFPTLCILAVPLLLAIPQFVMGRVLFGVGQLKWYAIATAVEAACNLVLSLALVYMWGIRGVAVGTAVPCAFASVAVTIHACRVLSLPIGRYVAQVFILPLLAVIVPSIIWLVFGNLWDLEIGWTEFFALGTLGMALYAATVVALELRNWRLVARNKSRGHGEALTTQPLVATASSSGA